MRTRSSPSSSMMMTPNNEIDYGSNSSSLSPNPTSTCAHSHGNSTKITPIITTSFAPTTPTSSYSNNTYNNTTPSSEGPLHRYKNPIKPALKNGKIRSLSSMSSQSPSIVSTPQQYQKNRAYTYNTPPSSGFNRQHLINNNKYCSRADNSHQAYDDDDEDAWRKDGKELREKLLEEDDASGGNEFVINRLCKLKNYCDIADRVQDQFQATYEQGDKLEESYIMGNRLIKFLSEVLPTHHHYYSKHPEFTILRIKIQNDLLKVRNQMDDISYALDREVYKTVMRMQGLEFADSPGGRSGSGGGGKARRKKKVTFALEESHDDGRSKRVSDFDGQKRAATPTARTVNGPMYVTPKPPSKDGPKKRTGMNLQSESSLDLSLWETRDPEIEIVDMSTSSNENSIDVDDQSSSFDISNSSLEATTPSSFQEQIEDQKKRDSNQPRDFGANMFDLMGDDGWESSLSWPDGDPFQQSPSNLGAQLEQEGYGDEEDKKVTSYETSQTAQPRQITEAENTSESNHNDYDDSSSDSDSDSNGIYEGLDAPMEDNEPFVEKIARENVYRGINELREEGEDDDSDADDSWEQDDDDDKDDEASSINLDRSHSSAMSLSMEESYISHDQSMEENGLNTSDPESHLITLQQEFLSSFDLEECGSFDDYSSNDGSADVEHEQFVKDMTEMEFSNEEECDPISIDGIIIPTARDQAVLEFPDEIPTCDSSGADKTVVTASTASTEETEVMSPDDDSQGSKSINDDRDQIIGIHRRPNYYPTCDSPQLNDPNLPIRLDYLECKVKDLQVKHENRDNTTTPVSLSPSESSNSTSSTETSNESSPRVSQPDEIVEKSPYPVQMARSESDPILKATTQIDSINPESDPILKSTTQIEPQSDCTNSKVCKKEEEASPSSPGETSKAHPTAARLRNLRKTAAWKRRFGNKTRQ